MPQIPDEPTRTPGNAGSKSRTLVVTLHAVCLVRNMAENLSKITRNLQIEATLHKRQSRPGQRRTPAENRINPHHRIGGLASLNS